MPTFLDNLRRFSQLGIPQIGTDPTAPGGTGTFTGEPIYGLGQMNDPFIPKHDAQDRFRELITNFPERNKPGILRKIAAGISAFGTDPNAPDKIMYAPYYRELNDWKTKMEPLGDLARIENQENTQNRLLKQSQDLDNYREGVLGIREAEAERRRIKDEGELDIKRKRLELDQELANGGRAISDRDGNMFIVTKKGEVKDIDKTSLSFADRMRLQAEGRMTIVNDQQEAARELARLKGDIDAENARLRGEIQKDVNAAKPTKADQLTPNEIRQEKLNRVAEYVRDHPEVADRIEQDDLGNIKMSPKSVHFWQSPDPNDAKTIQEFNDWVDRGIKYTRAGSVPSAPSNAPVTKPAPIHVPGGKITKGPVPLIEQREEGQIHTFPNGNRAVWRGGRWHEVK